jgi:MFS transporter, FHS family, glucose/mannose:H+ symporter
VNAIKLNVAFVLTGVATTILGPMTPLLQARWRIGDAEAGLLFTAQFFTSVWGAAAVGPLARRFGYTAVVVSGLALTALGMAGCALASWPLGLLSVACYGLGLGFSLPAGNLALAGGETGARAVVWLNWSWCVGAVAVPALTGWFGFGTWWIAAAGLSICAALLAFEPSPRPAALAPYDRGRVSRAAIMTGAFLFVYVATEEAISGWVASLALRDRATSQFWAVAPSIFWAGVLAGRAITPTLLRKRLPPALVFAGLALAAAGAFILILAHSPALELTAGAICGLGLAPIYPLMVAQYAAGRDRARGTSGIVFAAGGLGGAVGPLATGYVSQASGSLRTGLAIALPAIAVMAWLQGRMSKR